MATLVKNHGWYYAQFYDGARKPKRKRVPLKTRTKRKAKKIIRKLEDEYASHEFDPWTGYDATNSDVSVSKHSTVKEVLDYYIVLKSREDWRSVTTKNTAYILHAFGRFLGEQASIQELSPEAINAFLNRDSFAYATKKSHKKKLLALVRWCVQHHIVRCNLGQVKIYNNDREQSQAISYLSDREIITLNEYIRNKVTSDMAQGYQNAKRNALWLIDFIEWQRYSGMRVSETLSLRPENINTDTWEVTIGSDSFSTKSKAKQVLPIGKVEPLKRLGEKLLGESTPGERLFKHKDRRRTSRTFKKYLRLALPEREDICLHSLRHTCCINLLRKGVPIYTVQRWMRHASLKTTQNYADLLNMDISEQIGSAFSG